MRAIGGVVTGVVLAFTVAVGGVGAKGNSGPPVLGATKAAWARAYGPYLKTSTDSFEGWRVCSWGGSGQIQAAFFEGRAKYLEGAYCTDGAPSLAVRLKQAQQYFPKDAVPLGKYRKSDGSGVDREYFSLTLSGEFFPGDFPSCDIMTLVKPGTFSLNLDVDNPISWQIGLGTCT